MGDVDPVLGKELTDAKSVAMVDVILVINDWQPPGSPHCYSPEARWDEFIRELALKLHEQVNDVHFLANIGVLFVTGSAGLVRHLVAQDFVLVASAGDSKLLIDGMGL